MSFDPSCPAPLEGETIGLAHGGGGRAMWRLLHELVRPVLGVAPGAISSDAAVLPTVDGRLAFTTDASVIRPLFFPGGDIGKLAVYGTVNDLTCVGATPLALSLSLIVEEGLPRSTLERVLASIAAAAREAGVSVVTGDTKVVDRGKGDGLYTSVAGIGVVPAGLTLGPEAVCPGDAVLVSGDVGRHGVAILSVREGLAFDAPIVSDCASVAPLLAALLAAGVTPRCLRDPTRGGLCAALHEIALDAKLGVSLDERAIPIEPAVVAACELLGLDALSMACEGRLVVIVAPEDEGRALAALRSVPIGQGAARVGTLEASDGAAGRVGRVTLTTQLGTKRLLDFASGEQLPRIC